MRLPQLPSALWWSHNTWYHAWLLRQLPDRPGRALDAGCGVGTLARRLAERSERVDAVDRSPRMIEQAAAAPAAPNVRWLAGDLLDDDLPLPAAGYDVVTSISTLHHLPLWPGLTRLTRLVRPGGTLVVVGLYRPVTVTDYALAGAAVPADVAVGAALALRGRAGKPDEAAGMPVREPGTTFREIAAAAAVLAPGARLRRRLFFRYSLVWRRPPGMLVG